MNINWQVRIKNKAFWLAVIPAMAIFVQAVGKLFGFTIDTTTTVENLINIVNALFVLLVIVGVVSDPTTAGLSDSERALTYTEPK